MARLHEGDVGPLVITNTQAFRQEVMITPGTGSNAIKTNGQRTTIARTAPGRTTWPGINETSRPCPPFHIHPTSTGEGVGVAGGIEVIISANTGVTSDAGLLINGPT